MLIGDRARVGNNIAANIVGTNGEATLHSDGRKLVEFGTVNKLNIVNTFLSTKKLINLIGSNKKTQINY
jgi:hypothetical protein